MKMPAEKSALCRTASGSARPTLREVRDGECLVVVGRVERTEGGHFQRAVALPRVRRPDVDHLLVLGGAFFALRHETDFDRTVATLLGAGGEAPVITKKPEGAYSLKLTEGLK